MESSSVNQLNERYTRLSDRFRSLWTFYQFLSGVFKHRGDGPLPFTFDFQALYRQLQELVPQMGMGSTPELQHELDRIDRELERVRQELAKIESAFGPSTLRRFFDHLKRQDEKILFALVKFYLLSGDVDGDSLDKLDILLTRLAEVPLDDGRVLQRDERELEANFARLADFGGVPAIDPEQEQKLLQSIKTVRSELRAIDDFQNLVDSRLYDRYRELKGTLGRSMLLPSILTQVVGTNIEAKNRFRQLYQDVEVRILEDTNRIFEIERYLERNPDLAHPELVRQIERFRESRQHFDSRRRDDNLKKEDILELRKAMLAVLEEFDPMRAGSVAMPAASVAQPGAPGDNAEPTRSGLEEDALEEVEEIDEDQEAGTSVGPTDATSLSELLPSDSLLDESLHKIMFALELVAWDRSPEQAAHATELHRLQLEPWEVGAYRWLAVHVQGPDTLERHLQLFFLTAAALRVKMEEETSEIARLAEHGIADRLIDLLERSAQSLERAREIERRFQWFLDDMLYRGDTERLEQVFRSRFRLLKAYATLWLEHQAQGGITPL